MSGVRSSRVCLGIVVVSGLGLSGIAAPEDLPRALETQLDPPIQMSIGDVEVVEGDPPGTTAATFQVTLSGPSASPITASWGTRDGSAVSPGDYAANSGVVTFNPTSTSETVVVQVVRNLLDELDRAFYVDLSNPSGAELLKSRGVGTILDDDADDPGVVGLVVISDDDVPGTTGRNRLQWRNPYFTGLPLLRIRWNERAGPCTGGDYPTGVAAASDGLVTPDVALVGSHESQIYEHTGLALNVNYCYTVWVLHPAPSVSSQATGRPFDATGPVKWKYFTGSTAIVAPAVGHDAVVAVSNDQHVHAMERGVSGGAWPPLWDPVALGDVAQNRSPVVTSGGVSRVFVTTQNGRVQAIDVKTGAVLWSTLLPAGPAQAAPAGIFSAWGAPWDYILVGTSASSNTNRFYALDPADGSIVDEYPKAGDDVVVDMGPILQMASVDYSTGRVYLGLIDPTLHTLISLQLGPSTDALQLHWGIRGRRRQGDRHQPGPPRRPGVRGCLQRRVVDPRGRHRRRHLQEGRRRRRPQGLRVAGPEQRRSVRGNRQQGARADRRHRRRTPGQVERRGRRRRLPGPPVARHQPPLRRVVGRGRGAGGPLRDRRQRSRPQRRPGSPWSSSPTSLVIGAPALDIGHDLLILGSEAGTYYAVSVPLP